MSEFSVLLCMDHCSAFLEVNSFGHLLSDSCTDCWQCFGTELQKLLACSFARWVLLFYWFLYRVPLTGRGLWEVQHSEWHSYLTLSQGKCLENFMLLRSCLTYFFYQKQERIVNTAFIAFRLCLAEKGRHRWAVVAFESPVSDVGNVPTHK